MEKLVDMGLAKSIGVSNYNVQNLLNLLNICKIKPLINTISKKLSSSMKLASSTQNGAVKKTNNGYNNEPIIALLVLFAPRKIKLIIIKNTLNTKMNKDGVIPVNSFIIIEIPLVPPITKSLCNKNTL